MSLADMLKTDFSLVDDREATSHPAWPAFRKDMEGRAYGWEAVNTAWRWFKAGWSAAPSLPPGPERPPGGER